MLPRNPTALFLGALALLAGCGDDADSAAGAPSDKPLVRDSHDAGLPDGAVRDAAPDAADPSQRHLYAIANEIFTDEESTTYVNVVDSLDIDVLDQSKGIEYGGGRATIATYAGWLFVASPEAPVITRFAIAADGSFEEDGELSCLAYGFQYLSLDDWGNTFISPEKAYLFNAEEGSTLIWNPTTMEIVGEVDQGDFELVRELGDINGSAGALRGQLLLKTLFWTDWESWHTSAEQYLLVYDTETDTLLDMVEETRCPGLGNLVARDEADNLYFSNWIWNVAETLVAGAPRSCVLRIAAGEERFDPDYVLAYAELAEGREGAMFTYLGDGRAMISVFHAERATIDANTVPDELASTDNWRLWTVELESRAAAPLDGIPFMAGATTPVRLDGREFVLVPGEDWSVTHVYELGAAGAIPAFDIDGWSYQFLKIR